MATIPVIDGPQPPPLTGVGLPGGPSANDAGASGACWLRQRRRPHEPPTAERWNCRAPSGEPPLPAFGHSLGFAEAGPNWCAC